MANICDHTSVGIFVWRDGKLLLIQRARPPFGIAIPAGHVDDHGSFEQAAQDELSEEVGLKANKFTLIAEGRKENACRREDGTWHYWKMYQAEGAAGDVQPGKDEAKMFLWADTATVNSLAERTEEYRRGGISEEEWQSSPGLEPVMYDWFKELKII